jgi:hypothetical protein
MNGDIIILLACLFILIGGVVLFRWLYGFSVKRIHEAKLSYEAVRKICSIAPWRLISKEECATCSSAYPRYSEITGVHPSVCGKGVINGREVISVYGIWYDDLRTIKTSAPVEGDAPILQIFHRLPRSISGSLLIYNRASSFPFPKNFYDKKRTASKQVSLTGIPDQMIDTPVAKRLLQWYQDIPGDSGKPVSLRLHPRKNFRPSLILIKDDKLLLIYGSFWWGYAQTDPEGKFFQRNLEYVRAIAKIVGETVK